MPSTSEIQPVVIMLGPTASGKTDAAIAVAKEIGGEIISSDSRLFYRGMDIGTAKPTAAQLSEVRHHLVSIADPDEPLSLAVFQGLCTRIIVDLHKQQKIPILVGGTGQYIRAITEDWKIPEQAAEPPLRKGLEQLAKENGAVELFRYLQYLDPQAADSIDSRNIRRVVRALEVILLTGKKFSDQKAKGLTPYRVIQLGIRWNRQDLYQRIDMRIEQMIKDGLVDEVRSLLAKGYTSDLPGMSAIGYNEIADYLNDRCTLEESILLIKRKTRQFIRRQANWFKPDDPDIHWFDPCPEMVGRMVSLIRRMINVTG